MPELGLKGSSSGSCDFMEPGGFSYSFFFSQGVRLGALACNLLKLSLGSEAINLI